MSDMPIGTMISHPAVFAGHPCIVTGRNTNHYTVRLEREGYRPRTAQLYDHKIEATPPLIVTSMLHYYLERDTDRSYISVPRDIATNESLVTPCWIWTGRRTAGGGYFHLNGRRYIAHRLAYELAHGPIPDGKRIAHRCGCNWCVNPDHLRQGSRWKGRGRSL